MDTAEHVNTIEASTDEQFSERFLYDEFSQSVFSLFAQAAKGELTTRSATLRLAHLAERGCLPPAEMSLEAIAAELGA